MSTRRARVQLSTRFLRVHDSTGSVLNPSRMVCMRSRQRDGRRASDPTIDSRYLWSFACSEQEIDRRELIKEELNARIRTSRDHYCDCATCLDRPQGVNDYGFRCFRRLGIARQILSRRSELRKAHAVPLGRDCVQGHLAEPMQVLRAVIEIQVGPWPPQAAITHDGSFSGTCCPEPLKTRRDRHSPNDSYPSYTALYRKNRWFPRSFTLTMSSQGAASGRNSTPAITPGRSGCLFRPAT